MSYRLTPEFMKLVLVMNEGFNRKEGYHAKDGDEERIYRIEEGKLICRRIGQDPPEDDDIVCYAVCTPEETRRFIRKYDYLLNMDDAKRLTGYIRRSDAEESGLDADYILVIGRHPSTRPADWEMHAHNLYTHKREYVEYVTNGVYTLPGKLEKRMNHLTSPSHQSMLEAAQQLWKGAHLT